MTDGSLLRAGAVALVTGASAGIGTAIAEALIAKGCRVVCAARRLDRLRALAERLGPSCHPFELDVSDPGSTDGLCERLPEELQAVDVLVNNAGHDIGGRERFDLGDVEHWAGTIATNVTGLMRVTAAVIPGMVARHRGHVINIGSVSGLSVYPGGTAYNASKFAVHGFSGALRADYAGSGIRVTEIMPGTVRTDFAAARLHGDDAGGDAFYEQFDDVLAPEDIARCVVFALKQPPHVAISQLVVVPASQW
jgi:NADP-dependent 3-hydroxy acid dehydrogenase YdfG